MSKKDEALKLALEYLRDNQHYIAENERHAYVMEYNAFVERLEALAEHPDHHHEPIKWSSHEPDGTRHNKPAQTQHGNIIKVRVWHDDSHDHNAEFSGYGNLPDGEHIFYTSLPSRKPWVGLTEQERNDLEDYCEMIIGKAAFEAIEAKLREKNNG